MNELEVFEGEAFHQKNNLEKTKKLEAKGN